MIAIRRYLTGLILLFAGTASTAAGDVVLVTEELMVPAVDPGISLYVRNKRPQGVERFPAEKILLYVHGSTHPSETAFDLRLNGLSWMDYIAQRGYDVYLVDVRGYGKSTRPPEMDKPATENEPIVRTETAVKDVGAAVDFILRRRGVSKINLLGWSWGTAIMGWYTAQNNDKVNRLVLYAPAWIRSAAALTDSGGKLPAPHHLARRGEGPMADRRARGQEGKPDPGGLVRGLGGCHLRNRSSRLEADSAGTARPQRSEAGRARFLGCG
jgi:pimeloyl-ACP methyl ester carboxylesterase